MHIDWRPDIYKYSETVLPLEVYEQAVDEKYYGKGMGHVFFDFLKDLRDEKRYDEIELSVNTKNKAAYEMYLNCGFTGKSINMGLL